MGKKSTKKKEQGRVLCHLRLEQQPAHEVCHILRVVQAWVSLILDGSIWIF